MPYIGKVLEQVAPYMERMFITYSIKSDLETKKVVWGFAEKYADKVVLEIENVDRPGDLTKVQQDQLDKSTSDWILFMSDDDYWPEYQLEKILQMLGTEKDIRAYSVTPYQVLDQDHHDSSWRIKSFSKFFRREGARYIKEWPRELIADKDNRPLYWRKNPQVKKLSFPEYYFYHLSYMKDYSFRKEDWATRFRISKGDAVKLPMSFVI